VTSLLFTENMRNSYKVLVGETEEKRKPGKHRRRLDNIKVDFKEMLGEVGVTL
jgi:hypothetical protein